MLVLRMGAVRLVLMGYMVARFQGPLFCIRGSIEEALEWEKRSKVQGGREREGEREREKEETDFSDQKKKRKEKETKRGTLRAQPQPVLPFRG